MKKRVEQYRSSSSLKWRISLSRLLSRSKENSSSVGSATCNIRAEGVIHPSLSLSLSLSLFISFFLSLTDVFSGNKIFFFTLSSSLGRCSAAAASAAAAPTDMDQKCLGDFSELKFPSLPPFSLVSPRRFLCVPPSSFVSWVTLASASASASRLFETGKKSCSRFYLNSTTDGRSIRCLFNNTTLDAPAINCRIKVKPCELVVMPKLAMLCNNACRSSRLFDV